MTRFRKESTVTSSLLIMGGAVGEYGLALVSSIVLTRLMSVHDYGLVSFLLSPVWIVSTICLFGLPFLFVCDVAKLEEKGRLAAVRGHLDRGLVIAVASSIIVTLLLVLAWTLRVLPDHNEALLILAIYASPASLMAFAGFVFTTLQRVRFAVASQLVLRLLTLVTVAGVYLATKNVVSAVGAAMVPLLLVAVIEWFLLRRIVPPISPEDARVGYWEVLKRSASYGRWVVPQNVVAMAFMPAALWIVGFRSMTETAYLKIAFVLATMCSAPFVQLVSVLQQRLSRFASYPGDDLLRTKGREVQDLVMPIVLVVASLVIIVHRIGIQILYGPQYAPSSRHVMVLVPSVVFYILFYLMTLVPNARGRVDGTTKAYLAGFACFVALAWVLVGPLGAIGAAWALLLSRVVASMIILSVFSRHVVFSARWLVALPLLLLALLVNWQTIFIVPAVGWLVALIWTRRIHTLGLVDAVHSSSVEETVRAP